MASASVMVTTVEKIAQRPAVQLTAASEDSVWTGNASVRRALPERTAVKSGAPRTAMGKGLVSMGPASAKRAMWGKIVGS